jgi:uroporphyrinogen III methyltransferase/synthase
VEGTLATITGIVEEAAIKPPALIIVGEVVRLRSTIDWFERRPLFGRRMVVTRTREQASELVALLEENGADCLEYPTLHMEPVQDYSILDQALTEIGQYEWLLFTSINAVTWFFRHLNELDMDVRSLGGPKIAVVGRATAGKLRDYGLRVDLIPETFTGEGLAEALIKSGAGQGSSILLPRAEKAREVLPEMLSKAGARVTVAPVYRNVPPQGRKDELRQRLEERSIDLVTFTSSSTVDNFLTMVDADSHEELHRLLDPVKIAVIGPITAATVRKHGLEVDIQPQQYTIGDMVHAIVNHYQHQAA